MSLHNWLKSRSSSKTARRRHRRRKDQNRRRLLAEQLEHRHLLAVVVEGSDAVSGTVSDMETVNNFTVPAGDDLAIVLIAASNGTEVTAASDFGGETFGAIAQSQSAGGSNAVIFLALLGDRGTDTSETVTTTWSQPSSTKGMALLALSGVDQANPCDTEVATTAFAGFSMSSLTVPSEAGDLVVDGVSAVNDFSFTAPTAGPGQTAVLAAALVAAPFPDLGASYEAGAASTEMSWSGLAEASNDDLAHVAININQTGDITPPVIVVPLDVTVEAGDDTSPAALGVATAMDETDPDPIVTFSDVVTPGACEHDMTITRTWTAEDDAGNTASGDQIISVFDTTAPDIAAPPNATVTEGDDTSPAALGEATANDVADPMPAVTFSDSSMPGMGNVVEVITRTWTATDACGNSSMADQTITVEAPPADSFVVTTATDENDGSPDPGMGDGTSLREAVIAANADPNQTTITFAAGINPVLSITGAHEDAAATGDLDVTTEITIQGNGQSDTVIDAGGMGGLEDRVLHVLAGGDLTLDSLTITGGRAFNGFAGHQGGGIVNEDMGTLTVVSTTISGNAAGGSGGGVRNYGATMITNSTISGNSADGGGGGVYNDNSLTLTQSTVSGNTSDRGGGILNDGPLSIERSTISGNTTNFGAGGGIYNGYAGVVTLTNSTLSGNSANTSGGGIYNFGDLTIINSTIHANSNGGIMNGDSKKSPPMVDINNSIVSGSTGNSDVDGGGTFSGSNNIVQDGSGTGLTGTIAMDPLLGPLADNGGPTLTHALLPGSPAIDAGDNDLATEDGTPVSMGGTQLTTDQRGSGFRRINDGDGDATSTVDIGSFELPPALLVVDTLVDENDGIGAGDVSLRDAIAASPTAARLRSPSPAKSI